MDTRLNRAATPNGQEVKLCSVRSCPVKLSGLLYLCWGFFSAHFDPAGSPLEFFNMNDALNISWYRKANSRAQLAEALEGEYQMLEGDVQLRWFGQPNQTDEPVMAEPPDIDGDNTLGNWLDEVVAAGGKGMKLDFKSLEAVEPSLELLKSKHGKIRCPVWANADVLKGPGSDSEPIDAHR